MCWRSSDSNASNWRRLIKLRPAPVSRSPNAALDLAFLLAVRVFSRACLRLEPSRRWLWPEWPFATIISTL
jgi:hypothetical protein